MIREQSLTIHPVNKSAEEIKLELEAEAKRRHIENSTIITVNRVRHLVQVTTDNPGFIGFIRSGKDYRIVSPAV